MGFKRKTILIADDNEFFLQQQTSYLDGGKFHIHTASSGQEALDKIHSNAPDLILLDHIMQDMTGLEVCRILKADTATAHIPVIIVSSGEKKSTREEITEAGSDAIIYKPLRRDQLLGLVEEYLGATFRRWGRIPVSLTCEVNCDGTVREGTILSLGAGGLFLSGGLSFVPGDTCALLFSLPGDDAKITVREAIVVWQGALNQDEAKGAGLKFLTIASDQQERIEKYVTRILP